MRRHLRQLPGDVCQYLLEHVCKHLLYLREYVPEHLRQHVPQHLLGHLFNMPNMRRDLLPVLTMS